MAGSQHVIKSGGEVRTLSLEEGKSTTSIIQKSKASNIKKNGV
jgi:bifunctional ADP-heptose synthase (sugar kinase/adenylyltransferase)